MEGVNAAKVADAGEQSLLGASLRAKVRSHVLLKNTQINLLLVEEKLAKESNLWYYILRRVQCLFSKSLLVICLTILSWSVFVFFFSLPSWFIQYFSEHQSNKLVLVFISAVVLVLCMVRSSLRSAKYHWGHTDKGARDQIPAPFSYVLHLVYAVDIQQSFV